MDVLPALMGNDGQLAAPTVASMCFASTSLELVQCMVYYKTC